MTDPATDKLISKARRHLVKLGKDADAAAYKRGLLRAAEMAEERAAEWLTGHMASVPSEATALRSLAAALRKEAGEG